MVLCSTFAQVLEAWRAGKLALTFDIEGTGALNSDISMIELYYRLGVRQMLIAYNLNNDAGGGCHDDDRADQGCRSDRVNSEPDRPLSTKAILLGMLRSPV